MRARVRASLAVAVTLALSLPTGAAAAPGRPDPAGSPRMELVAQTPVVGPLGTFAVRLDLSGIAADGTVTLILHQRVRSRSELALSMEGEGLRTRVFQTASGVGTLPVQPDGSRRFALSLDPAAGGVGLGTEGVYPVELIAQDPAGEEVARLVTHLIVGPEAGDDAPSLGVAVVASVGARPALQPDGTVELAQADVDDMSELVTGLAAAPAVPATIAATPETIEALQTSPEPADAALVEALRAASAGRTVTALPYVEVSPDALAPAGLLEELAAQADRGQQVLTDALGAAPTGPARLAPPALGAAGLSALAASGVRRVVVTDDAVAPLEPGLIRYSLAQPFLLAPPADGPATPGVEVQALATDATVLERLTTDGSPGLVASRVLSELALLRLEQPSVARSVVVPLPSGLPARVVQLVLEGLGAGRPFSPLGLDDAFDHATPLIDRGDNLVDRPLLPVETTPLTAREGRSVETARAHLRTFVTLVGPDSPQSDPLARQLLLATAHGLPSARRREHVAAVEAGVDAVTSAVTTPATFTLTLTAREGTIPLTIRNDSGLPLHVQVHLSSQKLEFPDGEIVDLVLTEASTRIDIAVRARASGAFPLQVDVRTPDNRRSLTMTRFTVRSTAISGAGLVLSLGAGLFLIVWWASHWRRTRRSAKLVATDAHPARADAAATPRY